jgi:hypothetical protein
MSRIVVVVALLTSAAPPGAPAQTRATVYADGRLYVRRTIQREIPVGRSVVPLPFEDAVPGSLIALDEGVTIERARFPRAVTAANVSRRMVGQRIRFILAGRYDTSSAVILSSDPPRYQLPDGSVVFNLPGTPLFSESFAAPGQLAEAVIRSDRRRSSIELGYLLSGATWDAGYALTITRQGATLGGMVTLSSETLSLDSAHVVVVNGFVPKPPPALPTDPIGRSQAAIGQMLNSLQPSPPPGRTGGEPARAYALPGVLSIRGGESVSVPILAPAPVVVDETLTIPGLLPDLQRSRVENSVLPVRLSYRIGARTGPGTSLPPGTIRIFRDLSGQGLILVGESRIDGTAGGEEFELHLGSSQEITASRIVGESVPVRDTSMSAAGGFNVRTVATTVEYSVRFSNQTDAPRTVELTEARRAGWTVLSSTVPAETMGPGVRRFRITVPARAEHVFRVELRLNAL